MRPLRAIPSGPLLYSLAVLAGLAIAGAVTLGLAWLAAAPEESVARQVPAVVSGGLGGVALIGFAVGVAVIQHRRWAEARDRSEFDRVVQAAAELLATAEAASRNHHR